MQRLSIAALATLLILAGCDRAPPAAQAPGSGSGSAADPVKPTPPATDGTITVFGAASLKELLTEVGDAWAQRNGRKVQYQLESSATLAKQIQQGAKADLFVSAAPEWIDAIKPSDRYDWLSNRLVLAVPKDDPDPDPATLESLALANEQVPAGKYAKAAFEHLEIALPAKTIYGSNVRDVLSKVSQGGAKAGAVYATDVPIDPAVRVGYTFPAESHPKILYTAGLITPAGRALYDALREPGAIEAARRRGFKTPE